MIRRKLFVLVAMLFCAASLAATPAQARFLQVDPVGYQDDNNLNAYVHNDPSNKTDPRGQIAISCTYTEKNGRGYCNAPTDDGDKKHVNITTSLIDKNGKITSKTESYKNAYVARVGDIRSIITAQFKYGMHVDVRFGGPSLLDYLTGRGVSAAMAAGVTVLQTGGRTINEDTARALGFENRREAGRALEELKQQNGLRNDFHGKIMSNGDYVNADTGEVIDNIHNYR